MKLSKEKLFEILKKAKLYKDNDIQALCPWCGHNEFYISLADNHPWQCWRKSKCEADKGNIYTLLDKLGIPVEGNIKQDVKWNSTLSNALIDQKNDIIDVDIPEIRLPLGFRRVYNDTYLNKRGFKEADYESYHIGITNLDKKLINYIIFCIYNDYKLVATLGRYKGSKQECETKKIPRYKNSNSDFAKILGGYDELEQGNTDTVILVEGIFDKKNVDDLLQLKEADNVKCCYTFKCEVSEEQIYKLKLKDIKNLVLLYDGDVINQIKKTALKIMHDFDVSIALIESENDPGDMQQEELNYVLSNVYSPLDFALKKVQVLNL